MNTQVQKKEVRKLSSSTQLNLVLNRLLADSISLKLQAKQAHWNIKGANFIALHQLFDSVASEVDNYSDMLAERNVQLGGNAAGSLEEVSNNSKLEIYSTSSQHSEHYIKSLVASLKLCYKEFCSATELSMQLQDAVTTDLLTEIARGLDKQRWLVESNLTSK